MLIDAGKRLLIDEQFLRAVADRVAQAVVRNYLGAQIEPVDVQIRSRYEGMLISLPP
ncbi:hypothetical protein [Paraburkholderia mimosarum]|uniref:hypothetical protein n=1 Tax=Paraburkholderia mimosarum TaxID=312026 RepID=UPI0012DC8C49|nr:hypothetical protein [Paraburkholderia mimosarum]